MTVFDSVASAYAAGRPHYPPALYDALERFAGPLAGRDVVDLGAGTGIATAGLLERGARVTAVEPSDPMRARLAADLPGVEARAGTGEATGLPTAGADLVTCAQAWHWVEPERGAAEVARLLRPGGALAVWWNHRPEPLPPYGEAVAALLAPGFAGGAHYARRYASQADVAAVLRGTGRFGAIEQEILPWTWRPSVERYLAYADSTSSAVREGAAWPAISGRIEAVLRVAFPDGAVEESYTCWLTVARVGGAA